MPLHFNINGQKPNGFLPKTSFSPSRTVCLVSLWGPHLGLRTLVGSLPLSSRDAAPHPRNWLLILRTLLRIPTEFARGVEPSPCYYCRDALLAPHLQGSPCSLSHARWHACMGSRVCEPTCRTRPAHSLMHDVKHACVYHYLLPGATAHPRE